jgi:hypothetical protein
VITESNHLYITSRLTDWAGNNSDRVAWLAECAARHLHGDDGDLDPDDHAVNDHARRHRTGRVLSAFPVPMQLGAALDDDTHVWVITDDLDDPDTATTILWPTDY